MTLKLVRRGRTVDTSIPGQHVRKRAGNLFELDHSGQGCTGLLKDMPTGHQSFETKARQERHRQPLGPGDMGVPAAVRVNQAGVQNRPAIGYSLPQRLNPAMLPVLFHQHRYSPCDCLQSCRRMPPGAVSCAAPR